ncbi:MAG: hypothetical protein NC830_02105 [Candidatus Omnitrophica bacterium]|nr:hypothetical protein [Candidatus Omnitrophota bacterium]
MQRNNKEKMNRTAVKNSSGMTFMEIMIVISIIALVTSGVILGFTSLSHSRLRSSAYMLSAAAHRAFSLSTSRNESVRLVIDFENNSIDFESTEGKVLIDRNNPDQMDSENEEEKEKDKYQMAGEKESRVSLSSKNNSSGETKSMEGKFDLGAKALAEKIKAGFHEGEVPRYKPPRFSPIDDPMLKEKKLENGVRFFTVYSQMMEEEKKNGRAYIYFSPDGTSDHTAIQITGKSGEIYTVEILPTSARTRIYNYPFVPDFSEDEEEMER